MEKQTTNLIYRYEKGKANPQTQIHISTFLNEVEKNQEKHATLFYKFLYPEVIEHNGVLYAINMDLIREYLNSTEKEKINLENKLTWFLRYRNSDFQFTKRGYGVLIGKLVSFDNYGNTFIVLKDNQKGDLHSCDLSTDQYQCRVMLRDLGSLVDEEIEHIASQIIGVTPHLYGHNHHITPEDIHNFLLEGTNEIGLSVSTETYEILLDYLYSISVSPCFTHLYQNEIVIQKDN